MLIDLQINSDHVILQINDDWVSIPLYEIGTKVDSNIDNDKVKKKATQMIQKSFEIKKQDDLKACIDMSKEDGMKDLIGIRVTFPMDNEEYFDKEIDRKVYTGRQLVGVCILEKHRIPKLEKEVE